MGMRLAVISLLFLLQLLSILTLEVTIFPNGETASYDFKFYYHLDDCEREGSGLRDYFFNQFPNENWKNGIVR